MTGRRRAERRRVRVALTTAVAAASIWACGGDDRPASGEWQEVWESRQALVPSAGELIAGGADRCGELVGLFRSEMPALRPAPDPALDPAVDDWIAHAETIVFECSSDPADLSEQLETLDLLAAEVDAGLAADTDR